MTHKMIFYVVTSAGWICPNNYRAELFDFSEDFYSATEFETHAEAYNVALKMREDRKINYFDIVGSFGEQRPSED